MCPLVLLVLIVIVIIHKSLPYLTPYTPYVFHYADPLKMAQAYLADNTVVRKNTQGETFALSIQVFLRGQQTALHFSPTSVQDTAIYDSVREAFNGLCLHVS